MNRRGYSLIEVVIALVILSVVALSLGKFVGGFQHTVATSTIRTTAVGVAQDQVEQIRARSSPTQYLTLVGIYGNTTQTGFPGYPSMTMTTRATRTQTANPRADFTTITVTVTEPRMSTPVAFTTVMAVP